MKQKNKQKNKQKTKRKLDYYILGFVVSISLFIALAVITCQPSFTHTKKIKTTAEVDSYRLINFLKSRNSPIAEKKYTDIIIQESRKYGADYRLNVGIMGAESGLCKKPLKKYNCFGYMNGVAYDSFEHALKDIVPKVSRQYTSRYGWNVTAMGKAYGAHNVEVWEKNVRGTAGGI